MESIHSISGRWATVASVLVAAALLAGCAGTGYTGAATTTYDQYGRPVSPQTYSGQPVYNQGYVAQPAYASGPSGYAYAPTGYAATDYVYYPDDEVYYSPSRREYIYRSASGWSRGYQPPPYLRGTGVSVRLSFGDDPTRHHREVIRQYPGHGRARRDWDHDDDRR